MSSRSLSPPLWSSRGCDAPNFPLPSLTIRGRGESIVPQYQEEPMSSRSLSPPLWSSRGCDDERRAEPSMTSLSLRPRRPLKLGRRVTSMPALLPLAAHAWRDWSPPPQPSCGSFEHRGLHTPSHPQNQEESGSGSELDSPPHLIIIEPEDEEPHSPTSPPCSPLLVSPKESIFGSDTEEWHPSDAEEDQYFKSMVDNFVSASADVFQSALSEDEIDKAACDLRQSDKYADIALKNYNNDENNKVKYELIKAISSCAIMERRGCYGHVNFTAKGNQHNSKEELFFAEIRGIRGTYETTCVLSLEGLKKVGGLCESKYDKFNGKGLPVDAQHCYACDNEVKHPKDGNLYETGHVAISDYYHG